MSDNIRLTHTKDGRYYHTLKVGETTHVLGVVLGHGEQGHCMCPTHSRIIRK